ncbi:pseudoazurin [Bacterioplanoides sp.]|uniref:pseudoazurin n=1 Tax=Bacterioplanoides sp. TaxID=2066072 RepID=UPI003AFF909D
MKLSSVCAIALTLFAANLMAADHTVQVKNNGADGTMVFEPGFLKVAVGDTVTFEPTDPGHNSESVAGLIPDGAASWKSGFSEKITVTLDKEGVYVYKCLPHAMMAMVGVIQAGNATNLDAVKSASKSLSSTFIMNKERLDNYLAQAK